MQIEFTSRGLLATFFRHKIKLILLFSVCCLIGLGYVFTAQPAYESTGSLLVKFGRSATPNLVEVKSGPDEISQNDRRELLQSYMQILQSRDLLRGLVHDVGVSKLYPQLTENLRPGDNPVEAAITRLQTEDISVKAATNSDIIAVHIFNRSPTMAADFLRSLFDQFITRQSDVYNKQQIDFLAEQVKLAAERLHQSQKELRQYKEQVGVSSLDEELKRLLEQKMTASNIAITAMDKAKERLEQLEAQETTLLATYNPSSPAVVKIRLSIAKARQQVEERQLDLKRRESGTVNSTSETLVGAEISRIDRRIEKLESVRTHHDDLERQVKIDEDNYKNFEARSEAARVNNTLNEQKITRIVVLDTPMVATRPSRPRKGVIILFALMAGVLLGIGAAVVAETLDDRFSTSAQVSNTLQLPVLASFFAPQARR
jgi:uncharacterized protein involved in exopolysaccharide biosynthesis